MPYNQKYRFVPKNRTLFDPDSEITLQEDKKLLDYPSYKEIEEELTYKDLVRQGHSIKAFFQGKRKGEPSGAIYSLDQFYIYYRL